jgi:asparagine synthase (glutamine-hydrolysing)
MCGISGLMFIDWQRADFSAVKAVEKMNSSMVMRGPNAEGIWESNNIVLGHRRLSIQDLSSNANQPYCSQNGRFSIVFNGEIYNYLELKKKFLTDYSNFKTNSDTEVLIELFSKYGKDILPHLRGMFSFAIWDRQKSTLFLARDHFGIKPLYYTNTKDGFIFASQVKTLLSSNLVSNSPEYAGIAGFYLWGSVPEPWTIYENVFSLPAGTYLEVSLQNKKINPIKWLDLSKSWEIDKNISINEIKKIVKDNVAESLKAHLISDLPVGLFLSGGVDSGVLAKLSTEAGIKITGVTIAFDEFLNKPEDEVPLAKAIANKYNIKHYIKKVTKDEFYLDLSNILKSMDQPSIDGINSWYASKGAFECGLNVMLSGVGGDELFCGYSSFKQISMMLKIKKLIKLKIGPLTKIASEIGLMNNLHPKYKFCSDYIDSLEGLYFLKRCVFFPHELSQLMGKEQARIGLLKLGNFVGEGEKQLLSPIAGISYLESSRYLRNQLLRDSDWASMAHSVELRTPFVDITLLNNIAPHISKFTNGVGKKILAENLYTEINKSLLFKKKNGFGMPIHNWMEEKNYFNNKLTNSQVSETGSRNWARFIASRLITF